VPIPVDAMVSWSVREIQAMLTKHINSVVGRRMYLASMAKVKVSLDSVEQFAIDNPKIIVHLNMSGFDFSGKVFWVPTFVRKVVSDRPAKRVLNMVYRYVESADSVLAASICLL